MSETYLEVEYWLNYEPYYDAEAFFTLEQLFVLLNTDDWKYIRAIWPSKSDEWKARLASALDGAGDFGFPDSNIDSSVLADLAFDLLPSVDLFNRQCGLSILLSTLSGTQLFITEARFHLLAQLYRTHLDVRPELKRVSTNAGFAQDILAAMGVDHWPD